MFEECPEKPWLFVWWLNVLCELSNGLVMACLLTSFAYCLHANVSLDIASFPHQLHFDVDYEKSFDINPM